MRALPWLEIAWLTLVFAALLLVSGNAGNQRAEPAAARVEPGAHVELVQLAHGERGLRDASGHVTPLRPYRRIAAGGGVADELLLALSEPERVVALTQYARTHQPRGYLYGQRAELPSKIDLERLRELKLDLLVLNHLGAPAELERVRDAGIEVFDLGEMRGLSTLAKNCLMLGTLLGDEARGKLLFEQLERRMRAVAADIPAAQRKHALYVSAYAGQLFGGAAGTSYHDVLTAAGLVDVAVPLYRDWMHYDPEQVLLLDPEIIVTSTTSASQLCRMAALDRLRACRTPDQRGIVDIDEAAIGNPGLGMLDAAEAIRDRVYGPIRPVRAAAAARPVP